MYEAVLFETWWLADAFFAPVQWAVGPEMNEGPTDHCEPQRCDEMLSWVYHIKSQDQGHQGHAAPPEGEGGAQHDWLVADGERGNRCKIIVQLSCDIWLIYLISSFNFEYNIRRLLTAICTEFSQYIEDLSQQLFSLPYDALLPLGSGQEDVLAHECLLGCEGQVDQEENSWVLCWNY